MAAKPLHLIFIALFLVLPLSSSIVRLASAATYIDVTVPEAKAMIDTQPSLVLLDVRNQSEYDAEHVRNAKLIPLWELGERLNELNKTDAILVYCKAGGRSANASRILSEEGFLNVYNMLRGITEWKREGYPVYVKYPSIQDAIDNATAGDTIYISTGFYTEQLSVDKSIVLEGENRDTTIINGTATMFSVTADNVSISDFTVGYTGCACYALCAVELTNSQNTRVINNVIASGDFGIRVVNSTKVIIANNSITHANNTCVAVLNSSEVSMFENNMIAADGIELDTCTRSTFSHNTILSSLGAGIFTYASHENTFFDNQVFVNDSTTISISNSNNNTFLGNNFSSNGRNGIFLWESNFNSFIHNNFLAKSGQLSNYKNSTNSWDSGSEGNYWSNYTGVDADFDGIGDTPYIKDSANRDNHPLMGMFHSFNASPGYEVEIVSNSTIDAFEYLGANRTIGLRVSNTTPNQTIGFCRISIPHSLIDPYNGSISIVIDKGLTPVLFFNDTLYDNGTHRWISFTYPHSTHEILIVAEYPMFFILPLLLAAAAIAAATCRRFVRERHRARS